MQKFFIPGCPPDQTQRTLEQFAKSVGCAVPARRIYRIGFADHKQGKRTAVAEVGQPFRGYGDEIVAAILPWSKLYYVFTPSRGVVRNGPFLIGDQEIHSVDYFDDTPNELRF
jgi:hypothetical protein